MQIAILGTSAVGPALGKAFRTVGHDVTIGTRDPELTRTREQWADLDLPLAAYQDLDADVFSNATSGSGSLAALQAVGEALSGKVVIEWRSFESSDTSFIGKNRLELPITGGLLNARLVPTTTAAGTAYYLVRYISANGTIEFHEAWAVRPGTEPLRVRDVRIADPLLGPGPGGGTG